MASGKYVLCEKPLASTVEDAESMVKAADASGLVAACGFSYRRSPAISAIGEQIKTGALGEIQHFNGRYWCDYSADPDAPTSWRYEGPLGMGALADLGSHLVDISEQLCGTIVKIDGAVLPILIKDRPVPLGAALGHAAGGAVSDERRPVTNEDIATFVAEFANGAAGTFAISRVALGHPNSLGFEVFGTKAAASFDLAANAEFGYVDNAPNRATNGWRRVIIGSTIQRSTLSTTRSSTRCTPSGTGTRWMLASMCSARSHLPGTRSKHRWCAMSLGPRQVRSWKASITCTTR